MLDLLILFVFLIIIVFGLSFLASRLTSKAIYNRELYPENNQSEEEELISNINQRNISSQNVNIDGKINSRKFRK